ncbi:MAG: DUF1538 family protein, partial [Xanthomonadales bacterium]|nr:DUF1538 family protein [Xanthomonadales bacterium]
MEGLIHFGHTALGLVRDVLPIAAILLGFQLFVLRRPILNPARVALGLVFVLIGLALFLTAFIMAPVAGRIHEQAWEPYQTGELEAAEAAGAAWTELSGFLLANTREAELALFAELAQRETVLAGESATESITELPPREELPARVIV